MEISKFLYIEFPFVVCTRNILSKIFKRIYKNLPYFEITYELLKIVIKFEVNTYILISNKVNNIL